MRFFYQKPHPSLTEHVRTVLFVEGFSPSESPGLPMFTNAMPAFFCRSEKNPVNNEITTDITLHGKSVPPEAWITNEWTTLIAYFFYPFALPAVFGVSAKKLASSSIELPAWNPLLAIALKTQIMSAGSTLQKTEVLDHFLVQQTGRRIREWEIIRYATDQLMINSDPEALTKVLDKLNMNERTFQRIFKKFVGVTASQYRRICQFQMSFAHVKSGAYKSLTEVAFDNGFADQSHFNRSFKEFTTLTPNDYLRSGLKEKK